MFVATQRFGDCDEEEKRNSIYKDIATFRTDSTSVTFATYNVSIVTDELAKRFAWFLPLTLNKKRTFLLQNIILSMVIVKIISSRAFEK